MLIQFSGYIKNIAFFLIFISFIGIILPNSKYKKYIDVVLGLVLIIIILEPMSRFVFGSGESFSNLIMEMDTKINENYYKNGEYYEDTRNQMIFDNFKDRIKNQIENLCSQNSYEASDFKLYANSETYSVTELELTVSKNGLTNKIENSEIIWLKSMISDFYNLSVDNIHIRIQQNN